MSTPTDPVDPAPVEEPSHYDDAALIADNAITDAAAAPVTDATVTVDLAAAQVKATLALADAINNLRLLIADRT